MTATRLRPYRDADLPRVIEVMAATFAEYGMTFDPDGWDRDVREIGSRYAAPRGAFFAGCDAVSGHALGFVGVDLLPGGAAELHRLYIDPASRGRGLGALLCGAAESWAAARGAGRMVLWSDVRFSHAHRMYAGRGYGLTGQRVIGDPDRSVEFGMERGLVPGAGAGAGGGGQGVGVGSGEGAGSGGRGGGEGGGEVPVYGAGAPFAHSAEGARAVGIEEALADEDLGHRARMVAAAILDARALVRAGRMRGRAHELPHPDEVFSREGGRASAVLVLERGGVVGFEGPAREGAVVRVVHPLFRGD
jgi:GNAT superfamily N-acetyltransferase